jgi:branched-chain amino acid transport system substrate-binding protein
MNMINKFFISPQRAKRSEGGSHERQHAESECPPERQEPARGVAYGRNRRRRGCSGISAGQRRAGRFGQAENRLHRLHVGPGFFQITNDDFSNQIAAMKAGDASIISGTCYPNHFTTFWNQAAQSGLKPDIVTVAGPFLFPSGVEAPGDHGDGMSTEVLWNPHLPYHSSLTGQSAQELADEHEKSTGKQWTVPLGIGHSLWEVGIGALKAAAEPKNNKSVRESIATLNIDTVLGPLYFGKSPIKSVAVQPLTGGQWRKAKSGKYKYELLIVNAGTSSAKPDAEFKLLSQLG